MLYFVLALGVAWLMLAAVLGLFVARCFHCCGFDDWGAESIAAQRHDHLEAEVRPLAS